LFLRKTGYPKNVCISIHFSLPIPDISMAKE